MVGTDKDVSVYNFMLDDQAIMVVLAWGFESRFSPPTWFTQSIFVAVCSSVARAALFQRAGRRFDSYCTVQTDS